MIERQAKTTGLKRCHMCGIDKPVAEFYTMKRGVHAGRFSQQCKPCTVKRGQMWQAANPVKRRESARRSAQKRRLEILTHYAGGTPRCACCGEIELTFLSLDHVNNDGAAHRREIGIDRNASRIYGWLKLHGLPAGFQVLCMNCNWAKGKYGGCPHQTEQYLADAEHF